MEPVSKAISFQTVFWNSRSKWKSRNHSVVVIINVWVVTALKYLEI